MSRLANLLACLVLAAAFLLAGCGLFKGKQPQTSADPLHDETVLHLDSFVVNLADQDSEAYLRLGIDLGLDKQTAAKENPAANPAALGLIRDTVLKVTTTETSTQLLTTGGKDDLKRALLQVLQRRDPALGVKNIYFTDFLVQR